MHGLKQARRAWNKKIDNFLRGKEFIKLIVEHGVYVRRSRNELVILCLYVDDMLITCSCKKEIGDFKHYLRKEFKMSDLGVISYLLCIEFYKSIRGLMLHQRRYARYILKRFEMEECNAT